MTKSICISGYYGFDNFGDELILKVLVENLKSFSFPTKITVFSSNPIKTSNNLGVNSINSFDVFKLVNTIIRSDCIISGGGSLLQDTTSAKSLIYYLFILGLAQLLRKKTIIFAQGIGPINNKLLVRLTAFILKQTKYITVRDDNSIKLLKDWGINANKCDDPVWNINIEKSEKKGKIGIQLRNCKIITDKFISELAININKYYSNKELNILSLQNSYDLNICNKLKYELEKINKSLNLKIIENSSNENIIKEIIQLEELIAMRYHACLIAIKAGVKLLPINYDIKVENLGKEFNLIEINPREINEIGKIFEEYQNKNIIQNSDIIKNKAYNFKELEKQILN